MPIAMEVAGACLPHTPSGGKVWVLGCWMQDAGPLPLLIPPQCWVQDADVTLVLMSQDAAPQYAALPPHWSCWMRVPGMLPPPAPGASSCLFRWLWPVARGWPASSAVGTVCTVRAASPPPVLRAGSTASGLFFCSKSGGGRGGLCPRSQTAADSSAVIY